MIFSNFQLNHFSFLSGFTDNFYEKEKFIALKIF
jgi:hypothetical protein